MLCKIVSSLNIGIVICIKGDSSRTVIIINKIKRNSIRNACAHATDGGIKIVFMNAYDVLKNVPSTLTNVLTDVLTNVPSKVYKCVNDNLLIYTDVFNFCVILFPLVQCLTK